MLAPMTREGSYRSGAASPIEQHCGQPMIALEGHQACAICHQLFSIDDDELRAVACPDGITMKWRGPRDVVVEHAWLSQHFVEALVAVVAVPILLLWGSVMLGAGLGIIQGQLFMPAPLAVVLGLGVLALASGAAYVAAALVVNRTVLTITPTDVQVHAAPLRWGQPVRAERGPTERVIVEPVSAPEPPAPAVRRKVDRIVVERVLNDGPAAITVQRRGSSGRVRVRIGAEGDPPLRFIENASPKDAEPARTLLDHILTATRAPSE